MLGWGLFGGASLAAGLSGNEATLIAARAVQGLGAALMVPAALALLTTIFSGRSLATAFGVWGAVSGGAGAVGVLLGGALTDALGWEWIFFINVPVTLVGAVAAPALLPEAKLPRTSYDIAGGLTVTAGLALLVYALVETESNGWGSTTSLALDRRRLLPPRPFRRDRSARGSVRSCASGSSATLRSRTPTPPA